MSTLDHMSASAAILSQIKSKLRNQSDETQRINNTSTIFSLTKSLDSNKLNSDEFHQFVIEIHDLLIKGIF